MVIYTCECCNFSSNLISNYYRHLNTKKHKKRIMNNDNLRNDDFDIPKKDHKKTILGPLWEEKETILGPQKDHFCEHCNKGFNHKTHLYRHHKSYCKVIKQEKTEISELKNIIEEHKKIHSEDMKEKEKLYEYIEKLILNSGNTINIENQTNQINLNNFGEEDISHITDNFKMKMLKLPYVMVQNMIEKVHFNKNKPENKNIALTNKRDKMIKVLNKGCWKYKDKVQILDEMIKKNYYRLDDYYEEIAKNKMDKIHNNRYLKFQKKFDNHDIELISDIKKDTEMILLSDNL